MEELPTMPPLLRKTAEDRSVYPIKLTANKRNFVEIHMDQHCFEGKGKEHISPELIYYFALKLDNKTFIPEDYQDDWEYFAEENIFFYQNKPYRLVWCWHDNGNFIGIKTCTRIRKINIMVKRTINNYNYQHPERDREIVDKISDPNYEVGNYNLPENASVEDKFKYEICQTVLKYQQKNQISYQKISQQIDLPFAKTMSILKGRINQFTLNELVNYLEKLTIPCQVKIIPIQLKTELTSKQKL